MHFQLSRDVYFFLFHTTTNVHNLQIKNIALKYSLIKRHASSHIILYRKYLVLSVWSVDLVVVDLAAVCLGIGW